MTPTLPPWDKFATFDNFLLAWQRTVNATSRMVSDNLSLKTFAYNLDANLRDLVARVQNQDYPYEPLPDHKVYVPKPSTTLRTMSMMSVPDLIVYQALVNIVADQAHEHLVTHENQHVYGNLYAGPEQRWMLRPWKRQYSYFVQRIEGLFTAGNSWIASTDIVAFYDTIDHERLLRLVGRYCAEDNQMLGLFRKCLSKWSAHNASATMNRGIPQGTNASDFLANLFLYDIDREMIVHGHHYVRYVDDIRILGPDKPTVQRGLIRFDLELKRAGLVAQVSKTSVHKIEDIKIEINQLRFFVTDPSGEDSYAIVTIPSPPRTEQAESAIGFMRQTPTEYVEIQAEISDSDEQPEAGGNETDDSLTTKDQDIDQNRTENIQQQLRTKFLESFGLLGEPDRSKEAESTLTFCLNRMEPHESVRDQAIALLPRLPWRSEAVTRHLGHYKSNSVVLTALKDFIANHDVYSWHRANSLWALYVAGGSSDAKAICRDWLANPEIDWYARYIAAKVLSDMPGQHSFLTECLQREQENSNTAPEETAILRQQLAFGAFQRTKSARKQLALFRLICTDGSPLVRRLAVYLLQQQECCITWADLSKHHANLRELSDVVVRLGMTSEAPKPCLIAETLSTMYEVSLASNDLRPLYKGHYSKAVEQLRESVGAYHESKNTNAYLRAFHQFAHLSLLAFYEDALPAETGLFAGYASLTDRKALSAVLPRSLESWKRLGRMRNRVDHPVDMKTQTHPAKISVKEVEDIRKEFQIAFQELMDCWFQFATTTPATPVSVIAATV